MRLWATGRILSTGQLKEVFSSMLEEARSTQERYSGSQAAARRKLIQELTNPALIPTRRRHAGGKDRIGDGACKRFPWNQYWSERESFRGLSNRLALIDS
jgi:hypothetical protein